MKFKKQTNCTYYCVYHLVFTTKYRRKIFNDGTFAYTKERLKQLYDYYPEIEIQEINHDKDHIYMMISIPPKMSVGQVVRILKSNIAKDMKKKFPFLRHW
jgi:putative transposase